MRYLILQPGENPFFSDYFDVDNLFFEGLTVIDLKNGLFTTNGKEWKEIETDHL